jgi:hypothetical protein
MAPFDLPARSFGKGRQAQGDLYLKKLFLLAGIVD